MLDFYTDIFTDGQQYDGAAQRRYKRNCRARVVGMSQPDRIMLQVGSNKKPAKKTERGE